MGKVMGAVMKKVAGRADGGARQPAGARPARRLSQAGAGPRSEETMTQTTIQLGDNAEALALAGRARRQPQGARTCAALPGDAARRRATVERRRQAGVKQAADVVGELLTVIRSGRPVDAATVESLVDIAVSENGKPSEVYGDIVWSHRGRQIGPRTVNQKRYVDAIRANTITFGIGPAGTGKTYLAVAMAVAALLGQEVDRIILTRPAVEAGERLGFLPGTISRRSTPICGRCSTRCTT